MKVSVWPEVVGILGAIALGTVMLRGWPNTIVLTENFAAWVQAVGSIVAIGIAIYVSQREAKASERVRRAERRQLRMDEEVERLERIEACASIMRVYGRSVISLCEHVKLRTADDSEIAVESVVNMLSVAREGTVAIPLHEPPYAVMAPHVMNIQVRANEVARLLREATVRGHVNPQLKASLIANIDRGIELVGSDLSKIEAKRVAALDGRTIN